jgi:hypothetical protein
MVFTENHRRDFIFELRGMSESARTGEGKGSDHVAYSFDRCIVARSLWSIAGCSNSNLAPGLNVM